MMGLTEDAYQAMFKLFNQFKVVGDLKNITKASKVIGISQPTLTQNISRLEQSLGVTLLIRNKTGIELTEAGKTLYNNAIETVHSYDRLISVAEKLQHHTQDTLSIKCGFNWTHTDFFETIKTVINSHQHIKFNINNAEMVSLPDELIKNSCDIAMGIIPNRLIQYDEIDYVPVFKNKVTIYADKNHPLFLKSSITQEDLIQYKWVVLRFLSQYTMMDNLYNYIVSPENVHCISHSVTISLNLVKDTEYLIVLSTQLEKLANDHQLKALPIEFKLPEFNGGVMYLKKNNLAKEIAKEIVEKFEQDR